MTEKSSKPAVHRVSETPKNTAAAPESPSVQAAKLAPAPTVAETIWADIKDRPIEMFGLPNQTPANYCKPIGVEPSKLYLTLTTTATAVVSALETAFKNRYDVEAVDRYIVLSNKATFPFKK
jgi:hypothetical protein